MKFYTLTLLSALPLVASADDLSDYSLSLRLPTAFSHYSAFGDIASKAGASAATTFGSSLNPAGLTWGFQGIPNTHPLSFDASYALSGQYSLVEFDAGQELDFSSGAVLLDLADAGVLRLGFGTIHSNQATLLGSPLAFDLNSTQGRLDWGYRLNKDWRIGVGGSYAETEANFSAQGIAFSHSERESWSLRAGTVGRLSDRWFLGGFVDYGQADFTTQNLVPNLATGALTPVRLLETTHELTLRPGLAYALDKHKTSYAQLDYEWTRFSNDSQTFNNHRVLLGAEHLAFDLFHVRAGTFVDGRGNTGWTAGLGLHFPKQKFHVELAYQAGTFPEVKPEFGRSQTMNLSVAFIW